MKLLWSALILGAICSSGCATYSAVSVSTAGKAYVVRTGPMGQDMLRCEVDNGKPVCTPVQEQ